MLENGNVFYIHADHLNTPQVVTDDTQTVVWKIDQTPFGEATVTVNTIDMPLRFPGQYYDQETGLNYNYFRSYNPATGRYTQSDPIGLNGGLNLYSYVNQSPIINADPSGLITGNAGVCAEGTFQLFIGIAAGTCVISGTDGKTCTYQFVCLKVGMVEFGVGTSGYAGGSSGTDNLGGFTVGASGAAGLGTTASGGVSGSSGGAGGAVGGPGLGFAFNLSFDLCVWEKISCQGGGCD